VSFGTKEKAEVIASAARSEGDTGSPEVQISLLTGRINYLTEHFKLNRKDNHSRKGLLDMVSARKRLLKYLSKRDHERYLALVKKLGLRIKKSV